MNMSIRENIQQVRENIAAAALSAVLSAGAASEAAAAVSPADAHPASASMAAANNKAILFILKAPFRAWFAPILHPGCCKVVTRSGYFGDFCKFFAGSGRGASGTPPPMGWQ